MKYLVTGAQGCIGAWIVKNLVERGTPVVAYDRDADTRRLEQVAERAALRGVRFVDGDVRDGNALLAALESEAVTHIIHLAGMQVPACRRDPALGAAVNVIGTINVLDRKSVV